MTTTIPLERLARDLAHSIHRAWELSLAGHHLAHASFTQMQDVSVGDTVLECSTFYSMAEKDRRGFRNFLDSVGILEEVTKEPAFDDWNEEDEDGPCPLETVYYIRTLDGRRHRWVNAHFVRAPRYIEQRRGSFADVTQPTYEDCR